MTPKEIVLKHGMTIKSAAEAIGYSREHLTRVLNGQAECGKSLAKKLEHFTGGELDRTVLIFPERFQP